MTHTVPVFINAERVEVAAGITVLLALRAWSEGMADEVETGTLVVLDSRGLPVALDAPVRAGDIFRLIAARERRENVDDELH